jgi:O-antigen/teichoic acid export membrane protein
MIRLNYFRQGSTAHAALSLTTGRTIGFAATFVIPLVLSRYLTQEEFGVYKYLFLIYATLGFLQLGMSESLYFFVPRSRPRAGHAVTNAVIALAISGIVSGSAMAIFAGPIARFSGIDTLEHYLPMLGAFLALMLVGTPLEIVMVSRKEHRRAAVTYAVSDIVRAAVLIAPVVLTSSLGALMAGAVAFAAARATAVLVYMAAVFRNTLRIDRALWAEQWRYAIPFTIAVVLELVQINLHQYAVAARFDAARFAVYTVGCMQIPLVDLLATSTANVMMVRLAETPPADPDRVRIWHEAVERLAFVFVPLAIALSITARDVIGLLYPASYLPAVPIFAIAASLIVLAAFPVDGLLRVYADTRFLIVMNLIRLTIIGAGIGWALSALGLRGAILITVVAQVVAKVAALARIRRLLGVRLSRLLPWRDLGFVVAAAACAVVPAIWVRNDLALHPLPHGAVIAAVYGAVYLAVLSTIRTRHRWVFARLGWQNSTPSR